MNRDDFAPFSLWPIRVELPGKAGLTLWGGGGGDDDRLLAEGDRLLLFTGPTQLRDFVRRDVRCNLTELLGYQSMQRALQPAAANLQLEPVMSSSLVEVGQWLSAPRWDWDVSTCAAVLDGLNLLWDAANTLDEELMRSSLRRETGVLGRLADALTFIEEQDIAETLAQLERNLIEEAYREVLSQVAARTVVEGPGGTTSSVCP
jgi:hypothetical protein